MDINSLEIKNKTNYDLDNICCIDDFNVNSLKITKKESRIGTNIYYTRCALNLVNSLKITKKESRIGANIYYTRCALNLNDTIISLYFIINNLIGYIEEIDGSSDKYLVVASSVRNKKYNQCS